MPSRRRDVELLYPDCFVTGFTATLDAHHLLRSALVVSINGQGRVLEKFELKLPEGMKTAADRAGDVREQKRAWCLEHARCPVCHSGSLLIKEDRIDCACGAGYPQRTAALNMLSPEDYAAIGPENPAATSANMYSFDVLELIASVAATGGKVLDCGSGMRPDLSETVINLDIADYPYLDVISVGASLPFASNVFDAALSIAVLEHVPNPFQCAAELVRVLKPGGRLFVQVPFLQPEHGYPHHFFNATRSGLEQLFAGAAQVDKHIVPLWGSPILAFHWMAREYAAHLPVELREQFLRMSFGDLLSKPAADFLKDPIVTELSPDGQWTLACMTELHAHKPLTDQST